MPNIFIVGGPNGAGKTTTGRRLLPVNLGMIEFVNVDNIALGISAFHPESVSLAAGRIHLQRLDELADSGRDFAFETTLSSRSLVGRIEQWKRQGYRVHLLYLWLADPQIAVVRVRHRAASGGHSVPESEIVRRYHRGLANFLSLYAPAADSWIVYDNSGNAPEVVCYGAPGEENDVVAPDKWCLMQGGTS